MQTRDHRGLDPFEHSDDGSPAVSVSTRSSEVRASGSMDVERYTKVLADMIGIATQGVETQELRDQRDQPTLTRPARTFATAATTTTPSPLISTR